MPVGCWKENPLVDEKSGASGMKFSPSGSSILRAFA